MRPPAKIDEITFTIQANVFVRRNRRNNFRFIVLANAFEKRNRIVSLPFFARDHLVFFGQFHHFLFNGFQIFGRKRALVRKIVVKAVIDNRANSDLGLRKQTLHRVGQQVCSGMANEIKPFRVFGGYDSQLCVLINDVTGIHQLIFLALERHFPGQSGFTQPRANGKSDVVNRHRAGILALRSIGQCNLNHIAS